MRLKSLWKILIQEFKRKFTRTLLARILINFRALPWWHPFDGDTFHWWTSRVCSIFVYFSMRRFCQRHFSIGILHAKAFDEFENLAWKKFCNENVLIQVYLFLYVSSYYLYNNKSAERIVRRILVAQDDSGDIHIQLKATAKQFLDQETVNLYRKLHRKLLKKDKWFTSEIKSVYLIIRKIF